MAHIHELINAGVPARLARMLGQNRATTVWAEGSTAEDAVELTTNFCLLATTAPGQGVSLDFATGAALSAFYNLGPDEVLVYPAPGDNFNDLAADLPLAVPAGTTMIAIPSAQTWLAAFGGAIGEAPKDGFFYARQNGGWAGLPPIWPPGTPPPAVWVTSPGPTAITAGIGRVWVDTAAAGAEVSLTLPGNDCLVADRTGQGGTWPIMCTPPAGAAINGNPGYLVQGDWASAAFIWDGANFGV